MSTFEPFHTSTSQLARLLEHDENLQALWQAEELTVIWQHQLSASIEFDLGGLEEPLRAKLNSLTTPEGSPVRTFADLLQHSHPPPELLEGVKQFAKAHSSHPGSLLPREISMALYYVAIAAALLRHGQRISSLDNTTLKEGLQRVAAFPWLDENCRKLLDAALAVAQ
jgi:hypothetical protein